jgi:hypothetical protein
MTNNTQQITDIIFNVFENYVPGRNLTMTLSERAANELAAASLQQLANLIGGSLSFDNEGQAILRTGVYNSDEDRSTMQTFDLFNNFAQDVNINPSEVP